MIRSWNSIWRHCEKARARGAYKRRQPGGVAFECLEHRLALSLSHTVAPFAEATQTFVSVRVAPYQRHAEVAVASDSGGDSADRAGGKRQHIPLVTQGDVAARRSPRSGFRGCRVKTSSRTPHSSSSRSHTGTRRSPMLTGEASPSRETGAPHPVSTVGRRGASARRVPEKRGVRKTPYSRTKMNPFAS